MVPIFETGKAVKLIKDHDVIYIRGAGTGHAVPDRIMEAPGNHFAKTGKPRNLTVMHPCGLGDNDQRGLNHLANAGLIKRVIGDFWGNAPKMVNLAKSNKIEGYNIDAIVIDPDPEMTFISKFDPSLVKRDVLFESEKLEMKGMKNIILRRAAFEVVKEAYVNPGYGTSDGVPIIAQQERITTDHKFESTIFHFNSKLVHLNHA